MKKIILCSLFLIFSLLNFAQADENQIDPSIIVESISYENQGGRTFARIYLSNSCVFLFTPGIEHDSSFDSFREDVKPGREVIVDVARFLPGYELRFKESYCHSEVVYRAKLDKEVALYLLEVEDVRWKDSHSKSIVILSDGSKWETSWGSCRVPRNWMRGQRVIFCKQSFGGTVNFRLVNIDASYRGVSREVRQLHDARLVSVRRPDHEKNHPIETEPEQ